MKKFFLLKSASGAGLGTLFSRILGYVRDMLIAAFFGAGLSADAFYVAYRIPNLLRQLLGEGALSASFIPVFSQYLVQDEKEAWNLAWIGFTVLSLILSLLTILGIILAPFIVRLIAPGFFLSPEKFSLTVQLTRIMFPFFLFICLAALAMGILNSLKHFFIPALAPCGLSMGEIFAILVLVPLMAVPIKGLAIGVLLGGAAQLLIQLPLIFKLRVKIKTAWFNFFHPGLKKIFTLMIPATVGLGIMQINVFVDTLCASYLIQGSVTTLYYANRLVQLPLALLGTSLATVALPAMSRLYAKKDRQAIKKIFLQAMKTILFFLIPASLVLIFFGHPIIRILFQRGRFGEEATNLTYIALFFYSLGLVSYAGVKIAASTFYSMQDTKTPVKIASLAMLLNMQFNFIFMRYLGVGGLALATALSSTINLILLLLILRRRLGEK